MNPDRGLVMSTAAKPLILALRSLRRAPLFSVIIIATLGIAIGANTAVFSVVRTVLLKPLPFSEPDQVMTISHLAPGLANVPIGQSPALFFTYKEESRTFEETGMWDDGRVTVTNLGEPEEVSIISVTEGTLPLLRAIPLLGRFFSAEDDAPDTTETVVLAHGYWMKRFAGDPSAVGRSMTINGRPMEIIGVARPDLNFLNRNPALYLPFQLDRGEVFFGNFSQQGIGRLNPGFTPEQAKAELDGLISVALDRFPLPAGFTRGMAEEAGLGSLVYPLQEDVVGDVGAVLWLLLGTVGIVLLVACANVANLLLVRAESRQQELAIRSALGAGRGRIGGQLMTESLLLAFLGGVLGLVLAEAGLRLLVAMAPQGLPRLDEIAMDPAVLLFTLGVSVLAAVLFTALPMLKVGVANLTSTLREEGRGSSSSRQRNNARNVLVTSQIALALVLMIGSGLMIRSFQALQNVNPGFTEPAEVLTLRLSVPSAAVEDPEASARMHEAILRKIQTIPGVSAAGMSSSITMDGRQSNDPIFVQDFPVPADVLPPMRRFKWISPGYFETMGNPLLAGRSLEWTDLYDRKEVVVITENFAREYWPEPSQALGRRIRPYPNSPWREIVGVVGNVLDEGAAQEATAVIFWPMVMENFFGEGINTQRTMVYALRSPRVGTPELLQEVQAAVWSVNPNLPLAGVRTLDEIFQLSVARTSFTLMMLAIAALTALLLGAIGIYGVTSYAMSQRRREIGVRVAFGALPRDMRRLVLRHGGTLAALGTLVGLVTAFALTRIMASLLFEVPATDLATYVVASFGVGLITLAATWIPARRAARVDPIEALR